MGDISVGGTPGSKHHINLNTFGWLPKDIKDIDCKIRLTIRENGDVIFGFALLLLLQLSEPGYFRWGEIT